MPASWTRSSREPMDPVDGMDPLRTLQREAMEEARLAIDIGSRRATADGVLVGTVVAGPRISFYDKKDRVAGSEQGQLEPGIRFTFDLEVDSSFVPRLGEPEAATGFVLKAVDDVKRDLVYAAWKPNCGLVMLDFLLRKGQIQPEDDERYGLLKQGVGDTFIPCRSSGEQQESGSPSSRRHTAPAWPCSPSDIELHCMEALERMVGRRVPLEEDLARAGLVTALSSCQPRRRWFSMSFADPSFPHGVLRRTG